ncbi:hypothetical protein B0H16DRAFT_1484476 [Mycena metata]|uniref:F-box domain-containing protein n=1 Tax=Mycena metata TaxID=1033252 RepID=A0AAD7GK23_9AGAR|nr:hypothetical protein B0H16DRAFT_1484476 [Mycena metata]
MFHHNAEFLLKDSGRNTRGRGGKNGLVTPTVQLQFTGGLRPSTDNQDRYQYTSQEVARECRTSYTGCVSMALTSFPLLLKLPTETLDEIVSLQNITDLVQISRTSKLCHALATRHLYACVSLLIAEQLERFVDSNSSGPRPYEHLEHIKTFSLELDFSRPPRPAYLTAIGWMISSRMINLRKLQLERPENMLPLITLLHTVQLPRLRSLSTYFCPASAPHIEPFIALHPALKSLTLRLDSLHIGYNPHFQPFAQLDLPELQYYDGAAHLLPVIHAPSLRVMHLGWHGPHNVQEILATAAAIAPMVVSLWMHTDHVSAEELISATVALYPDVHNLTIMESGSPHSNQRIELEQGLRIANTLSTARSLSWLHINSDLGATSKSPAEQEEDNLIISIWEGLRCLRFVHFKWYQSPLPPDVDENYRIKAEYKLPTSDSADINSPTAVEFKEQVHRHLGIPAVCISRHPGTHSALLNLLIVEGLHIPKGGNV